jgi:hypothetical protein
MQFLRNRNRAVHLVQNGEVDNRGQRCRGMNDLLATDSAREAPGVRLFVLTFPPEHTVLRFCPAESEWHRTGAG